MTRRTASPGRVPRSVFHPPSAFRCVASWRGRCCSRAGHQRQRAGQAVRGVPGAALRAAAGLRHQRLPPNPAARRRGVARQQGAFPVGRQCFLNQAQGALPVLGARCFLHRAPVGAVTGPRRITKRLENHQARATARRARIWTAGTSTSAAESAVPDAVAPLHFLMCCNVGALKDRFQFFSCSPPTPTGRVYSHASGCRVG